MAYTNKTPNFQLPQYIGTDKPTYMGDFNSAMSTIDLNLYTAKTAAETASEISGDNATAIGNINGQINTINTDISTIQTNLTSTTTVANNANRLATGKIENEFLFVQDLGTYLSDFNATISSNTAMARVVSIGGIDFLNFYGGVGITYTGTPTIASITTGIRQINLVPSLKTIAESYGIVSRSFSIIGDCNFNTIGTSILSSLNYLTSDNTLRVVGVFGTGNAENNGLVAFRFQAFCVLGYKN